MAGIVNDKMDPNAAPNPAPADTQPPPPAPEAQAPKSASPDEAQEAGEDGNSNVTPEEQKQYDATVTAALSLIYSPEGFAQTIKKLGTFVDRVPYGIGHTAAMILMSVKKTVEAKGGRISDDVLFAAAQEIVNDLVEIARGVQLVKPGEEQTIGEQAFYEGMKVWGQNMQDKGEITPEMQQQAKADLAAGGHQLPPTAAGANTQTPSSPTNSPAPAGGIVNAAGAQ